MNISIELIELLAPCIEEQVKTFYYKYLTFACTQVQVEENKFEQVWKSFDDYKKDESSLTYKALDALQTLLLNIKE